jgi:hypothetical protein
MQYAAATVSAIFMFVAVALLQAVLIGQSLDGIRNPTWIESGVLFVGQLALPVAAGVYSFRKSLKKFSEIENE